MSVCNIVQILSFDNQRNRARGLYHQRAWYSTHTVKLRYPLYIWNFVSVRALCSLQDSTAGLYGEEPNFLPFLLKLLFHTWKNWSKVVAETIESKRLTRSRTGSDFLQSPALMSSISLANLCNEWSCYFWTRRPPPYKMTAETFRSALGPQRTSVVVYSTPFVWAVVPRLKRFDDFGVRQPQDASHGVRFSPLRPIV